MVRKQPLIVGECGATYYGRSMQLYPFSAEKAFESYYGRNEALAVDIYQNVVKMARPYLAYFSPSEVCWFGIEHLGIGYNDFSRVPNMTDGIFPGKDYEEGKFGYQFERIPPFVSTFNPGLDPEKPLYKPLPMFEALKAALAGKDCKWSKFNDYKFQPKQVPESRFANAVFVGMDSDTVSFVVSALDYTLNTPETTAFWQKLLPVLGISLNPISPNEVSKDKKEHNLLMDGPVD